MPPITNKVSLASYTTFRVGGEADHFAVARNLEDLQALIRWAKENNLAILFLGGGSNVLVNDNGFRGLVIKLELSEVTYEEGSSISLVTAQAGVVLDRLIEDTIQKKLWGLENLSHIPGSVGATPVQNVGAYGVEVSNLITKVNTLNSDELSLKTFTNDECQFGYRDSFFKTEVGKKFVVLSVTFELTKSPNPKLEYKDLSNYFTNQSNPELDDIRQAVISIRSQKFPDWNQIGTAGSFFKNPIITKQHFETLLLKYPELPGYLLPGDMVKVPLGWILDKVCNLRGYKNGLVGTYEGQSLVVINYGGATHKEVKKFAEFISEKVFATTEIKINWEVTEI